MLPFDPSDVVPAEYGEAQAVLEMDHEATVEHVHDALANLDAA
jgi:hypothetical protein